MEESPLLKMDAQEFRDLIYHDHQPDPGLETDQHGFGDEVGDEPQPEARSQHQHAPDQQRQCGRSGHEGRRIAPRGNLAEKRPGQNGDRCGGAYAEWARGPEGRVDHHG